MLQQAGKIVQDIQDNNAGIDSQMTKILRQISPQR